jgi:Ni,Fe-hydrogenase maturation factor
MSTRILCLGNELVRDDGVGIRIGRILMTLPLPVT